jgi:hypothetical protein
MVDDFCVNIYIPSLEKDVSFRQLMNREYKNILKYIQNDDSELLCEYFDHIIKKLCTEKNIKFNRIDKFVILVTLYIVCINPDVKIKRQCEQTGNLYELDIDLFSIVSNVSAASVKEGHKLPIDKKMSCILGIPDGLLYPNKQSIFMECLKGVIINNNSYFFSDMDDVERNEILAIIPGDVFSHVSRYIADSKEAFNDIPYVVINSPYTTDDPIEHTFDLMGNTLFDFLMFIFGGGLMFYYDMMYIMTSKLNASEEFAETRLTPAETLLYLKKYEEEIHEENKAKQTQSKQNHQVDPVGPQTVEMDWPQ